MRGIANFTFLGRIAKDPVMSSLQNQQKRLQVTAAANIPYQKDGKWEEDTAWITFAWFGDIAVRMAERVRKGTWILVTGEFRTFTEELGSGEKVARYNFRPKTVIPFEVITKEIREQLADNDGGSDG